MISNDTQDYLGNNRAVVNGSTGEIEQTVAYYPYGAVIADLDISTSYQPFKFGGKELTTQNGLNEYDFGARQYYPAVPGFTSVDALCEKTPDLLHNTMKYDLLSWTYWFKGELIARYAYSLGWLWHIKSEDLKASKNIKYILTAPKRRTK